MENINKPRGMVPVKSGRNEPWNAECNQYFIPASDTNAYFIGDLLKLSTGSDTSATTGYGVTFAPVVTKAVSGDVCVGVLVAVMTDNTASNTISLPATKNRGYLVMVADDPDTVFEMTDDGITTVNLTSSAVGKNCDFTVASPPTGMPVSGTVLKSSSIATTQTLPLTIVDVSPVENNAPGTFATWQVKFNTHAFRTAPMVNPIPGLSPAAYFKFNTGITSSGGFVSQWDDQSGNARHLLQATGTNQPALQGDGSILFDGVDNFLKCSAFTLNQPETIYLRYKPVAWVLNRTVFDGNTLNSSRVLQDRASLGTGVEPNLVQYAGSAGAQDLTHCTVGSYHTVCSLFNGASSVLVVDSNSDNTGNPSTGNAGGFTLGASGGGGSAWSNIQVKECAIFASAHDATTRAAVIAYLSTL